MYRDREPLAFKELISTPKSLQATKALHTVLSKFGAEPDMTSSEQTLRRRRSTPPLAHFSSYTQLHKG